MSTHWTGPAWQTEATRGCVYTHAPTDALYFVLNLCTHVDTGEELVIYRRWDADDGKVWARPRTEFEDGRFVYLKRSAP